VQEKKRVVKQIRRAGLRDYLRTKTPVGSGGPRTGDESTHVRGGKNWFREIARKKQLGFASSRRPKKYKRICEKQRRKVPRDLYHWGNAPDEGGRRRFGISVARDVTAVENQVKLTDEKKQFVPKKVSREAGKRKKRGGSQSAANETKGSVFQPKK